MAFSQYFTRPVITIILCTISVVFLMLAYASPYWIETFSKSGNPFLRAGLWEFCWNDWTFPGDRKARRFFGCWYVFSQDIIDFWHIYSPPWFVAVEVMMSCVVLASLGVLLLLVLQLCNLFTGSTKYSIYYLCTICNMLSVLSTFLVLMIFGIFKEDRTWMYRPDQIIFSWSFGCAVVYMLISIVTSYLLYKLSKESYADYLQSTVPKSSKAYAAQYKY